MSGATHFDPPQELIIVFEPLYEDVSVPRRSTIRSAGYDLRAYLKDRSIKVFQPNNVERDIVTPAAAPTLMLMPGERAMVPLGFKARLPWDYEAQVRPRSGKALKVGLGVVNAPGTIDADYPGEWAVLAINHSTVPLVIDHDEAIAQMVLARYEVLPFRRGWVTITTDRLGGFGSTGA